jgi:hypothetical protein
MSISRVFAAGTLVAVMSLGIVSPALAAPTQLAAGACTTSVQRGVDILNAFGLVVLPIPVVVANNLQDAVNSGRIGGDARIAALQTANDIIRFC